MTLGADRETISGMSFTTSVVDLLSDEPIAPQHRGLLPFRVWQILTIWFDLLKPVKQPSLFVRPVFSRIIFATPVNHFTFRFCTMAILNNRRPELFTIKTDHGRKD